MFKKKAPSTGKDDELVKTIKFYSRRDVVGQVTYTDVPRAAPRAIQALDARRQEREAAIESVRRELTDALHQPDRVLVRAKIKVALVALERIGVADQDGAS